MVNILTVDLEGSRLMSWTISLTFLRGRFDSMAVHITSTCNRTSRPGKDSVCDDTLKRVLSLVLNVELDNKQWSRATLPVYNGDVWTKSDVQRIARFKDVYSRYVHGNHRWKLIRDEFNLKRKNLGCCERRIHWIIDAQATTGLVLSRHTCEILAKDINLVDKYPVVRDFKKVHKEDLTFLCGPVLPGTATHKVLPEKNIGLRACNQKADSLLQAHDAFCLLKNST